MPAHRVPRVQLFCAHPSCGKPFDVTPGDKDRVRYCSPDCRRSARQIRMTKAPVTLLCAYTPCSKPFEVIPHQASIWKYCSSACYHLARTTHTHEAFTARFWKKVRICNHGRTCTSCCWMWMGAIHGLDGYGNFRATPYKQGNVSAHVVSWFLAHDATWPVEGLFVLHKCDTPPCVAPHHLFVGTHTDNMQDMISKGRQGYINHPERVLRGNEHPARLHPERMARGDSNGMRLHPESVLRGDKSPVHKITEAQVEEARCLYATGQWTFAQLGKRYGVTGVTIRYRLRTQNIP